MSLEAANMVVVEEPILALGCAGCLSISAGLWRCVLCCSLA